MNVTHCHPNSENYTSYNCIQYIYIHVYRMNNSLQYSHAIVGRKKMKQRLKESSADISSVANPKLPTEESMDTNNGAAHPDKTNGRDMKLVD